MKLNQKGLLIVISGPSGVGKGTVRKALFEMTTHDFHYSISMTTRKPREGEVNGIDYYFVSKEEFKKRIENDGFLEYAEFCGNYYGTPKDEINRMIDEGKEVVLEIEVQGAMQVKEKCPDGVFIFIAPPSIEALKKRLLKRGTENETTILERLQKAERELNMVDGYNYIVINDEVHNAADKIVAIIRAEHSKVTRALEVYLKMINEKEN